jgi:hypothetical protein
MCFSIGEFDMKVSRLLFASLLCGVLDFGVIGFQANAGFASNADDMPLSAEQLDQDETDDDQPYNTPDGGLYHGKKHHWSEHNTSAIHGSDNTQNDRFELKRVEVDISKSVGSILGIIGSISGDIMNEWEQSGNGWRKTFYKDVFNDSLRKISEHLKNHGLVVAFPVPMPDASSHFLTLLSSVLSTSELGWRVRGDMEVEIDGVGSINAANFLSLYRSIFFNLVLLNMYTNKSNDKNPEVIARASKYFNGLLRILSEPVAKVMANYKIYNDLIKEMQGFLKSWYDRSVAAESK